MYRLLYQHNQKERWVMVPITPLLLTILLSCSVTAQNRTYDQFTYGDTVTGGKNNIYGPKDWSKMTCPDIDTCVAWRDKYLNSQGWEVDTTNHCIWCPAGTSSSSGGACDDHHNSPINTERNRAIIGHPMYNQCIDPHWMAYYDSSCSYDELRELNAFTIERHSLRITQPMTTTGEFDDGTTVYKIACNQQPSTGNRWGRIDFPKGFSQWWLLSHIDFKVPSEHYQEGKQYDGEIQLHHFYSVTGDEAGVNNELGTVAIFLQVYEDAKDWPELNRIICAWREAEEKNRESCGLPSVTELYPGCFPYSRTSNSIIPEVPDGSVVTTQGIHNNRQQRRLRSDESALVDDTFAVPVYKPAKSAHDVIMENYIMSASNSEYKPKKIHVEKENLEDVTDFDWDAFLAEQLEHQEASSSRQKSRKLMNYEHVRWFNYFPMLAVRTEYYYRYSGSQSIPPCYGKFLANGNRAQINHWRVMKDPIRITKRQLDELHRLLKNRIAPKDDPLQSCKADTAAGPDPNGDPKKVTVARPLQSSSGPHFMVFCECSNWRSKWAEDRKWCRVNQNDQNAKFYEHPYNFDTDGF